MHVFLLATGTLVASVFGYFWGVGVGWGMRWDGVEQQRSLLLAQVLDLALGILKLHLYGHEVGWGWGGAGVGEPQNRKSWPPAETLCDVHQRNANARKLWLLVFAKGNWPKHKQTSCILASSLFPGMSSNPCNFSTKTPSNHLHCQS